MVERELLTPSQLVDVRLDLGLESADLLDHARRIAAASGGLLSVAFQVSTNERKVLEAIKRALTHNLS